MCKNPKRPIVISVSETTVLTKRYELQITKEGYLG